MTELFPEQLVEKMAKDVCSSSYWNESSEEQKELWKRDCKEYLRIVLEAIERGEVVEHLSICSIHLEYNHDCDICNAGRAKLKPSYSEFLKKG